KLAHMILNVLLIFGTALMIWRGMVAVSGSESPIVVVLRSAVACSPENACLELFTWFWQSPLRPLYATPPFPLRVQSGSMETAFYRGDILFISRGRQPLQVGDI